MLYIYRQLRNADPADDASAREVINNLFFSEKRYDLGDVGRYRINRKLNLTTDMDVRVLTKEDIIEIIKYLIELINSKADVDDIDHLSNRRVRTVGEQLSNQFATKSIENDVKSAIFCEIEVPKMQEISAFESCR